MKKRLLAALALTIMAAPVALTQNSISIEESFDSIINALLTPAEDGVTAVASWDNIESIKGVTWKTPHNEISKNNDYAFTRQGTIGPSIEVEINGPRSYISIASISFGINDLHTEFISIDHFNPNQLTKILTSCDEDGAMYQVAFYRWEKPGFTPLYVQYEMSFGSKMGNVDYHIGYYLDDILNPYPNPCKVLH